MKKLNVVQKKNFFFFNVPEHVEARGKAHIRGHAARVEGVDDAQERLDRTRCNARLGLDFLEVKDGGSCGLASRASRRRHCLFGPI